jgi:hypothetical protein
MNQEERGLVRMIIGAGVLAAVFAVVGYALWGHISLMPEHTPQRLFMPSGVSVHVTQDMWDYSGSASREGSQGSQAAMARFLQGGREMEVSIGGIPFRVKTDGSDFGSSNSASSSFTGQPAMGVAAPGVGSFRTPFGGNQEFRYTRGSGDLNSGTVTITPVTPR